MPHSPDHATEITPDILLKAYAAGIFPMAEDADDPSLFWVEPRERGIIPLDDFHISKRLARTVRSDVFQVRVDQDFDAVIAGCAAPAMDREKTWISRRIRELYGELFDAGYCHTVEVYQEGRLVGGLYGVRLTAPSSARACSTRSATPRRWRWFILWRVCAGAVSRSWTRSS